MKKKDEPFHEPCDDTASLAYRPFSGLKDLLDRMSRSSGPVSAPAARRPDSAKTPKGDRKEEPVTGETEFFAAMEGVSPIGDRSRIAPSGPGSRKSSRNGIADEDTLVVRELSALVSGNVPLPVDRTQEYIGKDRTGDVPFLTKRLHEGEFSVQGYCDLHGMDSVAALETCEAFLLDHMARGSRCIAFIHGRGLSSPGGPVLKELVVRWLGQGRCRRFVMAYSSAPPWDGGAGVTYVLLRPRHVAAGDERIRHG